MLIECSYVVLVARKLGSGCSIKVDVYFVQCVPSGVLSCFNNQAILTAIIRELFIGRKVRLHQPIASITFGGSGGIRSS